MASGNITVKTANKYISGRLAWSSTTDTANNRSTVTATLYLSRTNTGYTTLRTPNITITINGNKKNIVASSQSTFAYNSNTNCGSHSVVIPHNADGSKSCVISVSGSLVGSTNYAITTASQTVSLDKIPRYPHISGIVTGGVGRDRINVKFFSDSICDYWWYSLNNGSTWTGVGSINSSTAETTITGLSANTTYNITVRIRRKDSQLTMSHTTTPAKTLPIASPNTPTISSRTCIQAVMGWSSNRTVTALQYRLSGGAWKTAITFSARTSGSFTITGLTPGGTRPVAIRVKDAVHGTWSGASGDGSLTTHRLNTSSGASFSTGNSVAISLSRATTSVYSDVTLQVQNNSNSYINVATLTNQTSGATFSLSAAQLNTIYSNRINAKTTPLRFMIVNRWGSSGAVQGTSYSSVGTCTIANALPSIDGVSYKDTNDIVKEILNYEAEGANLLAGTSSNWETIAFGGEYYQQFFHPEVKLEVGETYTFSVVVEKVSADSTPINIHLGSGTTAYQHDILNWRENSIAFGQKVSLTHTITEDDLGAFSGFFAWRIRNEQQSTTIRFKEAKLEKGNTATPWVVRKEPKILRNLSTLQVIAGQATSQKYATLKSYKVSIGGGEYTLNTSGTSEAGKVVNVGKVNQSANQTAVLTVTDSRGYTASKSFTVQILDYLPPQFIQASADRLNSYEETTTMNIEARRSMVKPSTTDLNVIDIRYRLKENPSGEYGNYINVNLNESSVLGLWKSFTASQYMADYPSNKSYTIELGIKDKFTDWNVILVTLSEGIALLRFLQDKIVAGVQIENRDGQPYLWFEDSTNVKENVKVLSNLFGQDSMIDGKSIYIKRDDKNYPYMSLSRMLSRTAITVDTLNMNDIRGTGFYRGHNMTNAAVAGISAFIVINYSNDWILQIQFTIGGSTSIYVRSFHSGTTWGSWSKFH